MSTASLDKAQPWFFPLRAQIAPYLGLSVAVMYGVISISITIFNKAVLTHYGFNNANTLAVGQAVFSLLFLHLLKASGQVDYPAFSFDVASKAIWLMVSFVSMVVTGLASLAFVNIAMYTVLRRLTTCITLAGEVYFLKRVVPSDEQYSVVVMVLGAVLAGWGDLEFNLVGYVLILINCAVTAWYLIAIKQTQSLGLNSFALMYYNNIVALPTFFIIALFTEFNSVLAYNNWTSLGFIFCFLMSSMHAFLLNWSIFLCSTINSPLTTSVTGQLKNVLTTVLGFFLFGGAPMTMVGGAGLSMSTFSSMWYGYIKHQQSERSKKKIEKDPGPEVDRRPSPLPGAFDKPRSSEDKV